MVDWVLWCSIHSLIKSLVIVFFFVGDETTHLVHFGDLRYFLRHFNEVHNSGLVQKSLYWLYRFFSITR